MTIWTIACSDCEETRPARKRVGGLSPFQTEYPNCGSTEFESVVERD